MSNQVTEQPWGREVRLVENERYTWRRLLIRSGARVSLHYHRRRIETLYVVSGRSLYQVGRLGGRMTNKILVTGDVVHHRTYDVHRHEALEDLELMEVSTPPFDDIVRIADDHGRAVPEAVWQADLTEAAEG